MMLRPLALCLALVWCSGVVFATVCNEHVQCSDDYYCANSFCQKCIQCQDLKREQPFPSSCIKSVRDCGGCLKGLVVDLRNDVNAECVPPDSGEQVESLPTYFWPVFVVCLLLFGLVVGVVVYVLRNPETFRIIKASTRTSVESPFMRSESASAPAPPAYEDACYSALRADSPPAPPAPPAPAQGPFSGLPPAAHNPHQHNSYRAQDDESSFLFAKRAPSPGEGGSGRGRGRGRGGREAAATQAARVFNLPAYMRTENDNIPSPEGATVTELDNDTSFTHDEETLESPWTPNNTSDNDDTNSNAIAIASAAPTGAGAGGEAAPAPARDAKPALAGPSPPKILCVRQDSNNNRGAGSGSNSGARVVVNNFNVDFYASLQIDNSK